MMIKITAVMANSSKAVQIQLCDAIKTIICHESPTKWPHLIDDLVKTLDQSHDNAKNGALFAMHTICKHYRLERSVTDIKYIAEKIAKPLTQALIDTMIREKKYPDQFDQFHDNILLAVKVFYSLCAQDIPVSLFFKDDLHTWMIYFHEILVEKKHVISLRNVSFQTKNALIKIMIELSILYLELQVNERDISLDRLRAKIISVLTLFVQNHKEIFEIYLQPFFNDVRRLLVNSGIQKKQDKVSSCLFFPPKKEFIFHI